jgi:hypothetical protein
LLYEAIEITSEFVKSGAPGCNLDRSRHLMHEWQSR